MMKDFTTSKLTINKTALIRKYVIYVPSTINVDEFINNEEEIRNAQRYLSELCGGTTTIRNAEGTYVSNDGRLIIESVTKVTAYTNENIDNKVETYCKELCIRMNQECVSLEINNILYLIE